MHFLLEHDQLRTVFCGKFSTHRHRMLFVCFLQFDRDCFYVRIFCSGNKGPDGPNLLLYWQFHLVILEQKKKTNNNLRMSMMHHALLFQATQKKTATLPRLLGLRPILITSVRQFNYPFNAPYS